MAPHTKSQRRWGLHPRCRARHPCASAPPPGSLGSLGCPGTHPSHAHTWWPSTGPSTAADHSLRLMPLASDRALGRWKYTASCLSPADRKHCRSRGGGCGRARAGQAAERHARCASLYLHTVWRSQANWRHAQQAGDAADAAGRAPARRTLPRSPAPPLRSSAASSTSTLAPSITCSHQGTHQGSGSKRNGGGMDAAQACASKQRPHSAANQVLLPTAKPRQLHPRGLNLLQAPTACCLAREKHGRKAAHARR